MNLITKAMDFADAIRQTREFMELKQAQNLIDRIPTLKKKVGEIKIKQQEILSIHKPGPEFESKLFELNEEFKRLSEIPEINRFLAAGNNFNNMMSNVFRAINDSIESHLKI